MHDSSTKKLLQSNSPDYNLKIGHGNGKKEASFYIKKEKEREKEKQPISRVKLRKMKGMWIICDIVHRIMKKQGMKRIIRKLTNSLRLIPIKSEGFLRSSSVEG